MSTAENERPQKNFDTETRAESAEVKGLRAIVDILRNGSFIENSSEDAENGDWILSRDEVDMDNEEYVSHASINLSRLPDAKNIICFLCVDTENQLDALDELLQKLKSDGDKKIAEGAYQILTRTKSWRTPVSTQAKQEAINSSGVSQVLNVAGVGRGSHAIGIGMEYSYKLTQIHK